ncbi:MAG: HD domain-containing protein [Anaerolineales bacterium]|nr:HD domain-containing protein [Anaerolineales bacterium]
MDIHYRASQFFQAVFCKPDHDQLREVLAILPAEMAALFQHLPSADQCHSIRVLNTLKKAGEQEPDLLAAALMHDIGKSRFHLNMIERVIIVLAERYFPQQARRWGQGKPKGWKRCFVVAVQHPYWGADMVSSAGGNETLVGLIREHQTPAATPTGSHFADLLKRLQHADGIN